MNTLEILLQNFSKMECNIRFWLECKCRVLYLEEKVSVSKYIQVKIKIFLILKVATHDLFYLKIWTDQSKSHTIGCLISPKQDKTDCVI